MSSSHSFKDQLETITLEFVAHLHNQLQELASLHKTLETSPTDLDTIHPIVKSVSDIAHDLQGQGTLFGYDGITELAAKLEHVANSLLGGSKSEAANLLKQIEELIDDLKQSSSEKANIQDALFMDQQSISTIFDFKQRTKSASEIKTILLIEDAPIMRRRIAISLQQAGYHIIEAGDGPSGIEQAITHIPDLILLDIKLPDMDGFEVQKLIRSYIELVDTPLIFVTSLGRVNVQQIQTALSYGVTDYISKPFNMARLLEKVQTHLN